MIGSELAEMFTMACKKNAELYILFEVTDAPVRGAFLFPDTAPKKVLLIRTGDLDIPIWPHETPKQALLRWKASPV